MNQKGFISIIFIIIIGAVVAASATVGVVKYRDEIIAIPEIFKPEIETLVEISDIELIEEDKETGALKLVEEPIIEEKLEIDRKQDNAQKLQEQLKVSEQKRLEAEKQLLEEKAKQIVQKAEAETKRLKTEQETQKTTENKQKEEELEEYQKSDIAKAEAEKMIKEIEEAIRVITEQNRQEGLEKEQAEEKERIVNIENADQKLSQLISEAKELVIGYSNEKIIADDFISTIRDVMNGYLNSSSIQESGQQFINQLNSSSFLLGKFIDIKNDQIEELSSLLGSGAIISDRLSFLENQFQNYFSQYEVSCNKAEALMETFILNQKIALEELNESKQGELQELEEKIQRQTKANQTIEQLAVVAQDIDSQLADLDIQIKEKEAKIESTKNSPYLTHYMVQGRVAKIISELNPLIDQYNSLLGTRKEIVAVSYKFNSYVEYGTLFSAEDVAFLWSMGINFNP